MSKRKVSWQGVFPAVTTQFNPDFSINLDATQKVMTNLIKDGVSGLVVNGSVGENTSLSMKEKRTIVELAVDVAGGQIPVLSGIAELTTDNACKMVAECRQAGADGVMIMPPLVYTPTPKENREYFRTISTSTDLPVMLYNNPLLYKNDITPKILTSLADCENIVAFKDSSGNTRPFSDIPNEAGDRFILFAGLDDVVLESVAVGAEGWISGMSNAFPREGETLFRLAKQKRYEEARELYRWFMPLLHLDFRPDLVQCIKLCEEMVGRGSAITRPPRLPLEGETLVEVRAIVEKALANRPSLPDVGL
ncbi:MULTISPECIES: dihydrodipicolinate synthase family protein [Photorhabdus]|uniref:dihydrodipicolinate synthase family protein n=1 Tax=Photorhabdus TaxID=29487 RepID=UPI0021D4927E|nr:MULTISPECIES: dihydrodipicolinate synthase family protein [Photorhabdus]MCT8352356.1 dihydrodipicolinate synthase family protein [Photorhabdus kayaii]MDB6368771.1 dihydrodipicolinate synthase family protein [Photorhabdus bodei]